MTSLTEGGCAHVEMSYLGEQELCACMNTLLPLGKAVHMCEQPPPPQYGEGPMNERHPSPIGVVPKCEHTSATKGAVYIYEQPPALRG